MGGIPKSNYGISKFFLIQHAKYLAAIEPTVEAFSICPGLVATNMSVNGTQSTKLFCELAKLPVLPPGGKIWRQSACPYSPQQGAAVIDFCALFPMAFPGISSPLKSGEWYTRYSGCKAGDVVMNGFTDAMRPELYSRSLKLVGLNATSHM